MALDLDLGLTSDQLDRLGTELGECNFTSDASRKFLQSTESRDVQAAPGSGKTTLLVAKLLHARRRWLNPNRGICVLSHTNAARREVEDRLSGGEAADLLGHPNFVGTLTKFINQFIALPYLRGLGWSITVIDDDIFAARAIALARRSHFLRKQVQKQDQFASLATNLTIDPAFVPHPGAVPEKVSIADQKGLPNVGTPTRTEFEKIKAQLVAEGVFRYSDLAVLAERALDAHPLWAELLAARFPLLLVDEVQDSQGLHLRILDKIFRGRACVQRLGDSNQTIYDDGDGEETWTPEGEAIDLGDSRRFGTGIAAFSSKLTLRRTQTIGGLGTIHDHPLLLTFREGEAATVLTAFAKIVASTYSPDERGEFWVVAGRHRPAKSASGMSLVDYWPKYRAATSGRSSASKLHAVFRDAATRVGEGETISEAWLACCHGVWRLLRIECRQHFDARMSGSGIFRRLDDLSPGAGLRLREFLHAHLTTLGDTPAWTPTKTALIAALVGILPVKLSEMATDYLAEADQDDSSGAPERRIIEFVVGDRTVLLRLGSIASVKGQTHDATLVVQTTSSKVSDVKLALEVAAGHKKVTIKNPNLLKSATNVFVGATRPRQILCLALPEKDLSPELRTAVEGWGWSIHRCGSTAAAVE